jgi:hypothetical protein
MCEPNRSDILMVSPSLYCPLSKETHKQPLRCARQGLNFNNTSGSHLFIMTSAFPSGLNRIKSCFFSDGGVSILSFVCWCSSDCDDFRIRIKPARYPQIPRLFPVLLRDVGRDDRPFVSPFFQQQPQVLRRPTALESVNLRPDVLEDSRLRFNRINPPGPVVPISRTHRRQDRPLEAVPRFRARLPIPFRPSRNANQRNGCQRRPRNHALARPGATVDDEQPFLPAPQQEPTHPPLRGFAHPPHLRVRFIHPEPFLPKLGVQVFRSVESKQFAVHFLGDLAFRLFSRT